MTFNNLGLSEPILKAIASKGYENPSPIQEKAIPAVLEGRDVMAAAQTGTGKTAGFVLPILELLTSGQPAEPKQARVLILAPTRELAAQVGENVTLYGKNLPLSSAVVFGGVKINPQIRKLQRGVDILVATPGRLMDLYSQKAVRFDHLEVLVLDEADRMLDMGFIRDIKRIINLLPKRRQNLMFSATFSGEIRQLAKGLVHDPVEISVSPRNAAAPTVTQWVCAVDKKDKAAALVKLIRDGDWHQALVFTRTKHGANKLTKYLYEEGIVAAAIHGNKSQGARTKALAEFKAGEIRILVATDIAARGLDIQQLPQVVNFNLPNVSEDYVHRIGRTGRAGLTGEAISLVSADEVDLLASIERLIKKVLPRKEIDGFDPEQTVKKTSLGSPSHAGKPRRRTGGNTNARSGSRPGSRDGSRPGSRSGSRDESRGDSRNDSRGGSRSGSRGDSRPGSRNDSRDDSRGDSRNDSRGDFRNSSRSHTRDDSRGDSRNDSRGDSRTGSRGDSRTGSRNDSRTGSRDGSRNDSRTGSRNDSRTGSRNDSRTGSRNDSRTGSRNDSRTGSRDGSRNDSRGASRPGSRGDSRNDSRGDSRTGSRGDSRSGSRGDSRPGSRNDSRDESRGDSRNDSRGGSRPGSRGDSRNDSRGDSRNDSRGDSRTGYSAGRGRSPGGKSGAKSGGSSGRGSGRS